MHRRCIQGLLVVAAFFLFLAGCGKEDPSVPPPMDCRSISFHQAHPDPALIRLGARLGFNDITLQTERGTLEPLKALRQRADEKGYFALTGELGMTVSVWVHELEDYQPHWGPVELENERLWQEISGRYEYIFTELLPEIDNLILTVVETKINMTDAELLPKLVETINDQCRKHGKRLIFRTFVHHPDQAASVAKALDRLPPDVIIMTKCVPQDWHLRSIHNPMIGKVGGRKQIVEYDICGEYFLLDNVANAFTDVLYDRFQYAVAHGVTGINVRVDRGWNPEEYQHTILGNAQEANLWVLGYLASGRSTTPELAWQDFAMELFGEEAAETMIEVLQPTGKVIAETLCVQRETFGDTRRRIPAEETFEYSRAEAYPDTEDKLRRNPFARNWSVWRWDPSYVDDYHKIRKGDPAVIAAKTQAYTEALESANLSIEVIDKNKEDLPPGAYPFLRGKLESNLFYLTAYCEMELAWLKCERRLYCEDEAERYRLLGEIGTHLYNLDHMVDVTWPEVYTVWRGKSWRFRPGSRIDVDAWLTRFRAYWSLD